VTDPDRGVAGGSAAGGSAVGWGAAAGFGPLRGANGKLLDQIRLIGVTARGHHGVFEHERRDGQDFSVDAVLHVDMARAAATDDLAATVNYGVLATGVADIIRGEPVDLIETLAVRIAASILGSPGVHAVDVFVHKPQAPITEPFTDVVVALRREQNVLDLRPAEPVSAVLALGTNLGDRQAALLGALHDLEQLKDVQIEAVSPVVETDPVGGPVQPDYLNAVVLVRTSLTPRELLTAAQQIEFGHGRERTIRWGPRTLDIDLIRYGELLSADPVLELPHPRAAQRAFVLIPWLDADPAAWLPTTLGRQSVLALLAQIDGSGVRYRPDISLWLEEPSAGES
jgi:dihydroneopterin aldolase/2-amino-4-hydroxy-6-hydroxymethyldihydropteridine diphosphokinase